MDLMRGSETMMDRETMERREGVRHGPGGALPGGGVLVFALVIAAAAFSGCRSGVEGPEARGKGPARPGSSRPAIARSKQAPRIDQDAAQRLIDEMQAEAAGGVEGIREAIRSAPKPPPAAPPPGKDAAAPEEADPPGSE